MHGKSSEERQCQPPANNGNSYFLFYARRLVTSLTLQTLNCRFALLLKINRVNTEQEMKEKTVCISCRWIRSCGRRLFTSQAALKIRPWTKGLKNWSYITTVQIHLLVGNNKIRPRHRLMTLSRPEGRQLPQQLTVREEGGWRCSAHMVAEMRSRICV